MIDKDSDDRDDKTLKILQETSKEFCEQCHNNCNKLCDEQNIELAKTINSEGHPSGKQLSNASTPAALYICAPSNLGDEVIKFDCCDEQSLMNKYRSG